MSGGEPLRVRAERSGDAGGVRALHEAAFGRADEARLVDALRAAGGVLLSLVALRGTQVVGHVLFSPAAVEGGREEWPAVALGPMAVLPELQRTGIGTALVREGLVRLRGLGHRIVVVLGHSDWYPRFGFEPAPPHGIRCDWKVPDEVFQVLALEPDALEGVRGRARYRPEFDVV